ncbi:MAG: hypothetical protein K0S71_770 [Clostridia bacterium]|jgi:carbonic anhydrase/acetyltransferase-like protein (isoleucine patch superfamily)|nr:hypothetical protein [Clostridia bacterium]
MLHKYKNHVPKIGERCFIAEGAHIIGEVKIGKESSIWFNAVIRGDDNSITIGDCTNIQDNAVIHTAKENATYIGQGVTIGHSAVIHGAKIGDYTLIGMGSTILDGAQIGKECIIGAGSLVTANMIIPDGMLVLGVPAKVIKPLDETQKENIKESAKAYVHLSKEYI